MYHLIKILFLIAGGFQCHKRRNKNVFIVAFDNNYFVFLISGGFLSDAGWFFASEKVYRRCLELCEMDQSQSSLIRSMECNVRCVEKKISTSMKTLN